MLDDDLWPDGPWYDQYGHEMQACVLVLEELVSSLIHDPDGGFVLDTFFNGDDVEGVQHFRNPSD